MLSDYLPYIGAGLILLGVIAIEYGAIRVRHRKRKDDLTLSGLIAIGLGILCIFVTCLSHT